jgi:phosphoglycolate phosphatase-like HAD superfamily hydrolase
MKCAGVTWGFRSKDELISARADYIFESPWDILQVELL